MRPANTKEDKPITDNVDRTRRVIWVTPIIATVTLPAHAQTSTDHIEDECDPDNFGVFPNPTDPEGPPIAIDPPTECLDE